MRKLAVLAIILSLAMVEVSFAGYTVKPRVGKATGSEQIYTGACNIKTINFYSTAASDRVAIYDANISTGPVNAAELKFEIGISANTSSTSVPFGTDGINFSDGIYATSNNADAITSVVYDY